MTDVESRRQGPGFEVLDHTGKKVSSRDLKGKRYVLWFYPMADTPGCTKEGCGFRDRPPAYKAKGVEILGMSFDKPEANKAFVEKFKFPSGSSDTDKRSASRTAPRTMRARRRRNA